MTDNIINEVVTWTNQKIDVVSLKYKKHTATVMQTLLGILIFSALEEG